MTSTPSFPGTAGPVVPAPSNDLVHFRLEVDSSRCATNDPVVNARLIVLEQHGLTLSIAQLVASANLHFAESVQDEGSVGEGTDCPLPLRPLPLLPLPRGPLPRVPFPVTVAAGSDRRRIGCSEAALKRRLAPVVRGPILRQNFVFLRYLGGGGPPTLLRVHGTF
jgi:hypothetical protein